MKKVTSEIVEVFWEDNEPVGMLLMNGHAEFYRVEGANKNYIREMLLETQAKDVPELL